MDSIEVGIAAVVSSRPGNPADHQGIFRAMKLAATDLNDDPDMPYEIDLRVFDDEGDLEMTRAHAKEIVADASIVGVVGPSGSSEALANAPIFSEEGITQISPCASHTDLCTEDNDTFFLMIPTAKTNGNLIARFSSEYIGAREVSVVRANSAWAETASTHFVEGFQNLDGEVTALTNYRDASALEDGEMDDEFEAIVSSDPDLVTVFEHNAAEGEPLSRELRNRGFDAPLLGLNAFEPGIPGATGAEIVYQTHPGTDFFQSDSALPFRNRYTSEYEADSAYTPEAYDAVMLIGEALKRVKYPTRSAVLDYVRSIDSYSGASGKISFCENGERGRPMINFYRLFECEGERKLVHLGIAEDLL